MNIYELEKQATQGPLEIVEEPGKMNNIDRYIRSAIPFNRWGGKRAVMGVWIVYGTSDTYTGIAMTRADAEMLTHCRNNFMRALEALKRLASITDSEYPETHERHPSQDGTYKLIEELEEVK